ncbi:cob(I)yrinic acid a,c-diamide adenosyltransferase [candidate division WOR-3 bacterium]|nr:cob(I)yrinic acid a,c-diamide adenosyltransferase [candidate division WOR-3 bacterium]
MKIGTVQVYTGDGKGKTTAALGQALRASGHGFKIIVIQFMKGQIKYGELEAVKNIPGFVIEQYGLPTFVDKDNPSKEDMELAKKGFERAKEVILSGEYDMVILDEANVALDYGLIKLDEVIDLIKKKPQNVELILTGRYAPNEILEIADLVTDVREVKHHYQKGVQAREGIEY